MAGQAADAIEPTPMVRPNMSPERLSVKAILSGVNAAEHIADAAQKSNPPPKSVR